MPVDLKQYKQLILELRRIDVEAFDHSLALAFLEHLKVNAINYEGKLNFFVSGYEDDSRQLFEIPDVVKYIDFLDRCFPHWFYFFVKTLPKRRSPFSLLLSLKLNARRISDDGVVGKIAFDPKEFEEFMNIHFFYLNELTESLGLTEAENRRITQAVFDNLDTFCTTLVN